MSSDNFNHPRVRAGLFRDFLASVVVFFVALPLCLGIAIACGVPPALGLVTGIIAGIVVGSLSGCTLQVSGPAAGLTVLVWELVQRQGLEALGVVVLAAGLIQLLAGLLKAGRWFRAVSPAVIHGMLSGIGVILLLAQVHVMFDSAPRSSGLPNLVAIPQMLSAAFSTGGSSLWAGAIGVFTLAVLLLWKHFKLDLRTRIPSALPAIVGATTLAFVFQLPVKFVTLPASLIDVLHLPNRDTLSMLLDGHVLLSALTLALIASAETLLSATAVDQMQTGERTKYNKELIAQGIGNMLCGFVGSLPMTGVIARSTVNVQAGARTRASAIMHGFWLLAFVVAFPFILSLVPTAALAALLVYTGAKLVNVAVIKDLRQYGRSEVLIYAGTVGMIVFTDLLTGVLVGLLLSLAKLVWTMAQLDAKLETVEESKRYKLTLSGAATFLGLPRLTEAVEEVPPGADLVVDFEKLTYIDHSCLDLLQNWEKRQNAGSGKLLVDWDGLMLRFKAPTGDGVH